MKELELYRYVHTNKNVVSYQSIIDKFGEEAWIQTRNSIWSGFLRKSKIDNKQEYIFITRSGLKKYKKLKFGFLINWIEPTIKLVINYHLKFWAWIEAHRNKFIVVCGIIAVCLNALLVYFAYLSYAI